jgi:hypothetical protein
MRDKRQAISGAPMANQPTQPAMKEQSGENDIRIEDDSCFGGGTHWL